MSGRRERMYGGMFGAYKRWVSPLLAGLGLGQCRYLPTCSEYAYMALVRFGLVEGGLLALGRLARCHPWGRGGLDPVPEEYGCGCRRIHTASADAIYHTETTTCETHNELHS